MFLTYLHKDFNCGLFLTLSYHMVSDDEYNTQVNGLRLWSFYGAFVIFIAAAVN